MKTRGLEKKHKRPGRLVRFLYRLVRESMADGITGEAAKAAYFFFLSFFPVILALFALTGILGGDDAFRWIMGHLALLLPGSAEAYVEDFVREITDQSRPGMLSLGIFLTLWTASSVFVALSQGLNVMYKIRENRPWLLQRAIALLSLVTTLVLLTAGVMAILVGPVLMRWMYLQHEWAIFWSIVRWPLAFALLTTLMWLLYYWLPARDQSGVKGPTFVGALVGAALWLGATSLFRLYVANFGRFSKTYGVIGGIIVLLIWLYLTAFTILLGGEVAATLEQKKKERRARKMEKAPPAAEPRKRLSMPVAANDQ
jgi:membrane protein